METATFAAGCFWGIESAYMQIQGVTHTAVGFMGGDDSRSTYEEVCSGTTNHAEVLQVGFDPDIVSYAKLLDLFWESHNPTTPNRQGPDIGTQYRSAIFYHTPEQQKIAEISKSSISNRWSHAVVTEIVPASKLHLAEDYHQQYFAKRNLTTCNVI